MVISDTALIELAATLSTRVLIQCPSLISGFHAFAIGMQGMISKSVLNR